MVQVCVDGERGREGGVGGQREGARMGRSRRTKRERGVGDTEEKEEYE